MRSIDPEKEKQKFDEIITKSKEAIRSRQEQINREKKAKDFNSRVNKRIERKNK